LQPPDALPSDQTTSADCCLPRVLLLDRIFPLSPLFFLMTTGDENFASSPWPPRAFLTSPADLSPPSPAPSSAPARAPPRSRPPPRELRQAPLQPPSRAPPRPLPHGTPPAPDRHHWSLLALKDDGRRHNALFRPHGVAAPTPSTGEPPLGAVAGSPDPLHVRPSEVDPLPSASTGAPVVASSSTSGPALTRFFSPACFPRPHPGRPRSARVW
jgi:hypothetical protein